MPEDVNTKTVPSSEFVVHYAEGALDVLAGCRKHLGEQWSTLRMAESSEDLAERNRAYLELVHSYVNGLHNITVPIRPEGYGSVRLYPDRDHPLSLGFTYEKTGYTGGFIYWPDTNRWQIHT